MPNIALAVATSCSVIDFECFILDGAFPAWVREPLVDAINTQLVNLSLPGIEVAQVRAAMLTQDPRAIGSASLPLQHFGLLDRNIQ